MTRRRMLRIVLAEDDPDTRMLLAYILEREGHRVRAAGDGEEALALLRAEAPDLVLLDLLMPRVGGDGVARAMIADARLARVPVISVSASPAQLRQTPTAAALQKPFSVEELLATIERVAEVRGLGQAPSDGSR